MGYSKELVVKMYIQDEYSIPHIAELLGVYPNKVRRALLSMGIPLKSKSEAQKNALATGRAKHPTKGTKRDEETKLKISEKVSTYWDSVDKKTRQQQCTHLKEYRDTLTQEEKEELSHLASVGIRNAAKQGSKFERYLHEELANAGYQLIIHKKGAIINPNLEVDILIPAIKTAIEIDGPTHSKPIHGEEKLKKQQKSDAEKNGLLLNEGWVMIRFRHIVNNLTQKYKRESLNKILLVLKEIKENFPAANKRLINI